jgi:hypothetical protein
MVSLDKVIKSKNSSIFSSVTPKYMQVIYLCVFGSYCNLE